MSENNLGGGETRSLKEYYHELISQPTQSYMYQLLKNHAEPLTDPEKLSAVIFTLIELAGAPFLHAVEASRAAGINITVDELGEELQRTIFAVLGERYVMESGNVGTWTLTDEFAKEVRPQEKKAGP